MSWMQKLYETFDSCIGNNNIPDSDELCPVGYSVQNAHVEIVIDSKGNFRRASLIPKENARTLIPVTEKSLTGRTSGIAPHALCDSIQYCAGDYKDYGGLKDSYFDQCEFIKRDFKSDDDGENYDPLLLVNQILNDDGNPVIGKMKFDDCICWLNERLRKDNAESSNDILNRIHINRKKIEDSYPLLCPKNRASYLLQLERWVDSVNSHPSAKAVFEYVKQKKIVSDLIMHGILAATDGTLLVETKGSDKLVGDSFPIMKLLQFDENEGIKDQAKVFIRWAIEYTDQVTPPTWKDKTLFDSWRKYIESVDSKIGFCYVTGKMVALAQKHPSKLRNGKDGAKLISSNDNSGYTFLGRFTNAEQPAGVSSEVTQKAHSALRWLIGRKQAFRSGDQVFVSWAVEGKEIPDLCASTLSFLGQQDDITELASGRIGDVGQSFAIRLNKKIAGYKVHINDSANVVVMGLDSATKGRMAITFYRELTGSEFLERIEKWHSDLAWEQNFSKELHFTGAPSPKDIAWAAYCKKLGKSSADLDEKLLTATIERLLPCIVDGAQFPKDLASSCVRRVSNRIGLDHWEWEKCLGITCSLYKGIHKERRYKMALEEERKTRDYLYGRLLSVAEKIESTALSFAKESRDTTAARLMQRFADRPFSTWKLIENSLVPYQARINSRMPGLLAGYKELLDEIHASFASDDFISDKHLSGEYLLGYHCQRKWLREHRRDKGKWIQKVGTDIEIVESENEE
jgi:CRISPR-associated protein Csd1